MSIFDLDTEDTDDNLISVSDTILDPIKLYSLEILEEVVASFVDDKKILDWRIKWGINNYGNVVVLFYADLIANRFHLSEENLRNIHQMLNFGIDKGMYSFTAFSTIIYDKTYNIIALEINKTLWYCLVRFKKFNLYKQKWLFGSENSICVEKFIDYIRNNENFYFSIKDLGKIINVYYNVDKIEEFLYLAKDVAFEKHNLNINFSSVKDNRNRRLGYNFIVKEGKVISDEEVMSLINSIFNIHELLQYTTQR